MTTDPISHSAPPRLSHELRTPMNHIIGYSELLIEDAEDQRLEALTLSLHQIRTMGKELLALLNDTFSALRAEPQTVRLRQARPQLMAQAARIGEAVSECGVQAREQGQDSFLSDLHKIETAVKNFLAMVDQFSAPEMAFAESTSAPDVDQTIGVVPEQPLAGPVAANLLVVDDNAENREVLAVMLKRQGYTVTLADSGAQALEFLQQYRAFDLVLLDILMPGIDGFQVLQRMKSEVQLTNIPVIVISALDDLSDSVHCIELGAEDYLSKPFNAVLLRARIGASLEKKRLRDQELAYLKEVARLTYAAMAIENETFEPDSLVDLGARTDALGNLARVFMHMAHEVYEREAQLKQMRQQSLVIEVDVAKRASEVNTITSTAYFQRLKQVRSSRADGRAAN